METPIAIHADSCPRDIETVITQYQAHERAFDIRGMVFYTTRDTIITADPQTMAHTERIADVRWPGWFVDFDPHTLRAKLKIATHKGLRIVDAVYDERRTLGTWHLP